MSARRPAGDDALLVALGTSSSTSPSPRGGSCPAAGEVVQALDGVSLDVRRGETLGLVGETGCGKSTLARCLTRLYDLTSGRVVFDGDDISTLLAPPAAPVPAADADDLPGPVRLAESAPAGRARSSATRSPSTAIASGGERKRQVQELMELVGLNPEHYNRFPAEFSGGQRQRIGDRARARAPPEARRLRRAGLGARRLDPGADHQPARRPAGRARADLRLHRSRPLGGAPRQRPRRGHVPRARSSRSPRPRSCSRIRATLHRRRCSRRCRCPTRTRRRRAADPAQRATCRRRSIRRRAAASTRAARRRSSAAAAGRAASSSLAPATRRRTSRRAISR